jgi:outer membrane protein assembly factor BamA
MRGAIRRSLLWVLCIAGVCLLHPPGLGADGSADESGAQKRPVRFVPFPVLFITPETGLGFGAAGLVYVLPRPDAVVQKSDIYSVIAFYTQNNQLLTGLGMEKYFTRSGDKLNVLATVQKYPDVFYGIGPDTPSSQLEGYTPLEFSFIAGYQWRLNDVLYLGPLYGFSYISMQEVEPGGLLDQGEITGSEGTTASGVGLHFTADTRDSQFFPRRGFLFETELLVYSRFIGSEEDFVSLVLNYRKFFPVFEAHVFAFEYLLELSTGDVPFQFLPRMGGQYIMRGYREGRYTDMNYTALQGEYRVPLFWRFGATVFGALGMVSPDLSGIFSFEYIRATGGFGLRVMVIEEQKINFRFDVAFSEEGVAYYFNVREAF